MSPVLPPAPPAPPTYTVGDIILAALIEIGAIAVGEPLSAADAVTGLRKLNWILDAWSANRRYIYTVNFTTGPPFPLLVPNLQPHTIGPAGATFTMSQRPVKLVAANIILNNVTPYVRQPLNIRDADWWENQRVPAVLGTLSKDVYFEPDWPNGLLFFWPEPTVAYGFEAETWAILGQFPNLAAPFSMPPGYFDAVTYSLAESLIPSYQAPPNPVLLGLAQKARAFIQGLNSEVPRLGTRDMGIPKSGQKQRSTFNYRTGLTH